RRKRAAAVAPETISGFGRGVDDAGHDLRQFGGFSSRRCCAQRDAKKELQVPIHGSIVPWDRRANTFAEFPDCAIELTDASGAGRTCGSRRQASEAEVGTRSKRSTPQSTYRWTEPQAVLQHPVPE